MDIELNYYNLFKFVQFVKFVFSGKNRQNKYFPNKRNSIIWTWLVIGVVKMKMRKRFSHYFFFLLPALKVKPKPASLPLLPAVRVCSQNVQTTNDMNFTNRIFMDSIFLIRAICEISG